jgi:hypothetical protein
MKKILLFVLILFSLNSFAQREGRIQKIQFLEGGNIKKSLKTVKKSSNCEQMFDLLNDLYIHEKNWTKQQRQKYLKCNRDFHRLNKLP